MDYEKILLLNWRNFLSIVVIWLLCVLSHNVIYGLSGIEEPIFFVFAVLIIPFYFLLMVAFTIDKNFIKKEKSKIKSSKKRKKR